jgi:hypothetical protein
MGPEHKKFHAMAICFQRQRVRYEIAIVASKEKIARDFFSERRRKKTMNF